MKKILRARGNIIDRKEVEEVSMMETKRCIHDFIDKELEWLIQKVMFRYGIRRKHAIKEINKMWTKFYAKER